MNNRCYSRVEQSGQLIGFIIRRSWVQIPPLQLNQKGDNYANKYKIERLYNTGLL